KDVNIEELPTEDLTVPPDGQLPS
ncbi:DUF2469 domain-containing protein, partial [Xanthomonas citri pv. citri]|nr:DUF2469 domain-containing protein [Xanthomonas citri pv. citri]